jgi:hypothetical protein
MDRGELLFLSICITVLLPAGARIAGNVSFARKLGVLPLFSFGLLSLLIAFNPASTFMSGDEWHLETMTPLSASVGRPVFFLSGLFLIGLGIWQIVHRAWNRPDPGE